MSRADLEAELRVLRRTKSSEGFVQVLNTFFRCTAWVLIAFFAYLGVDSLAGKITFANIGINFLSEVKTSISLSITVGIIGAVYGLKQRKLRRDTVEILQTRIKELESYIDKNRSSSKLTVRGDTRPEDKL